MTAIAAIHRAACITAALLAGGAAGAQEPWTVADVESRCIGFQQEGFEARLAQISELLAAEPLATDAVCEIIHGDHREYAVRMEALLDNLTHERWLEREKAERALVEVGSRLRGVLQDRAQNAPTLEERIRVQRVLERIAERGTEDEDRRLRLLRGVVAASLYFQGSPRLCRALRSAAGHPDHTVVDGALRALGRHGGDDEVAPVVRRLDEMGSPHRVTALAALARLRGKAAEAALLQRLGGLAVSERLLVHRLVRDRSDRAELRAKLLEVSGPLLRTAADLPLPDGAATEVALSLTDRSVVRGNFLGAAGDSLVVEHPGSPPAAVEVPLDLVLSAHFGPPPGPIEGARVFLLQGSLLVGRVGAVTDEVVRLEHSLFGDLAIPRRLVQGVALAADLDRLLGASPAHDRVRLADGGFIDAEIVSFVPDGVVRLREAGTERELPAAAVSGLLFRKPIVAADTAEYTRVTLRPGDRLLGHLAGVAPGNLGFLLAVPDGEPRIIGAATIPASSVSSLEFRVGGGASWGFTLIADYSENRVLEVDDKGRELFAIDDVFGVWDVECLDSGNLLITEFSVSRVQEVTRSGEQVWVYEDLKNPYDADRLANGNTLITDTFGNRVVEVDRAGSVVWEFADNIRPYDADRLANGNTLIADALNERVIEVNRDGAIVWELGNLKNLYDADRLPNGNTLITQRDAAGAYGRVTEVDRDGQVVFELKNLNHPSDADRLSNGNTLVAESGMVREFDRSGNEIWRRSMTWAVEINRY